MQTVILIIIALLSGSHGYSYLIPASFRNFGICFYNGRVLPKGDSQMPMVCQNLNCREDGSIMVEGCGRISLPNCTLSENNKVPMKSYPDCCAMSYGCIDANGISYTKEWNQLNPSNSNPNGEAVSSPAKPKEHDYKLISPFILQLLLFV